VNSAHGTISSGNKLDYETSEAQLPLGNTAKT
jgi:hypothetical protein